MRQTRSIYSAGLVLLFIIYASFAEGDAYDIKLNGFTSLETGQIIKGKYRGVDFTHQWLYRGLINAGLSALIKERLHIKIGVEGLLWFNSFPTKQIFNSENVPQKYFKFYFHQGEGALTIVGDQENPVLQVGAGLFPYKYNPDVRNLGEYLFRSGTYPGYLINVFDFPMNRLCGLRMSSTLFDIWRQDLMLTTATDIPPFFDWSLSYITGLNIGKFLDIGGGILFSNLLSVDKNTTTPKRNDNISKIDTVNGDTTYYTFTGTKLMARFSLDVKRIFKPDGKVRLFGTNDMFLLFGEDDLKIYGEWAVIGLKNYDGYYENVKQRMPWMFGITIPVLPFFRIFDVCAVECEIYENPYPNSYEKVADIANSGGSIPVPAAPAGDYTDEMYKNDTWKWSIYARKDILSHMSMILQLSRDHQRVESAFQLHVDEEETMTKKNNWSWMFKVLYRI